MGRKADCASSNAKVKEVLELLQKEGHLSSDQMEYCSEACVQRYLRVRSGNVKKAAKQLRASLNWRQGLEIGCLTADDFPAELAAGTAFVAGNDDNGSPVLVLRTRQELLPPRSHQRFVRFLVFTLEVAVASMPPGVEQWVMLIDLSGCSKARSSLVSFVLSILKLISDHYPERLAPSFFVDAPPMFYYLWKGMGPFIEHATREKWSFASLKDHTKNASPQLPEAESSQPTDCSTPSLRHTCYEERLSAMSFLTPLSSPGGQSFFRRNLDHSLGAALASDAQHRSLSFSSPASFNLRSESSESLGFYESPVFLRSSRSRRSSREMTGTSKKSKKSRSWDCFRPYVKFCTTSYCENSYRASMKPPLGGLLSVIKNALNLTQTDSL